MTPIDVANILFNKGQEGHGAGRLTKVDESGATSGGTRRTRTATTCQGNRLTATMASRRRRVKR